MQKTFAEWFALRVRARSESRVSSVLADQGYDIFFPSYKQQVQWSDRVRTYDAALFPGYLFCCFEREARIPVVSTPGVLGVVGCGNRFLPVEPEELASIRRALDVSSGVRPWTEIAAGARVRIQAGPLSGLVGEVVRLKDDLRLVLRVSLLNRGVAVDIDSRWVTPTGTMPAREAAYLTALNRAS